MFFCASFSFWVAILALLPVASAGVSGLFPLLEKCEVTVNLESMLCGACVAFDVSLLAMTDITGAFAMTFYAGNLAPFLAKWRQFLVAFVELGCTPFLVFDSLVYTFEPKLQTQAARRKTRDAAAAALQKLKAEASGLSGAALRANQQEQVSVATANVQKMKKIIHTLQCALDHLPTALPSSLGDKMRLPIVGRTASRDWRKLWGCRAQGLATVHGAV